MNNENPDLPQSVVTNETVEEHSGKSDSVCFVYANLYINPKLFAVACNQV
jgi:hypothetical protein